MRRLFFFGVALALGAALALPSSLGAAISSITFTTNGAGGGELRIVGTLDGPNNISIREKTNAKTGEKFLEISDPAGVYGGAIIPGCSEVDPPPGQLVTALRCPVAGITLINVVGGDSGNDTVIFDLETPITTITDVGGGDDTVTGGPGPDTQIGGAGDDELLGGRGPDTQSGGPGDDDLSGEAGNDKQNGGPGNDFLHGGKGKDKGVSGPGNDKCKKIETGECAAD